MTDSNDLQAESSPPSGIEAPSTAGPVLETLARLQTQLERIGSLLSQHDERLARLEKPQPEGIAQAAGPPSVPQEAAPSELPEQPAASPAPMQPAAAPPRAAQQRAASPAPEPASAPAPVPPKAAKRTGPAKAWWQQHVGGGKAAAPPAPVQPAESSPAPPEAPQESPEQ